MPESANLPITLGEVQIEGGFQELATANAAFVTQVAHKSQTVGDLFEAARQLERAYAGRGYILARVTIPPQTLSSAQTAHVVVIDGFIEALDLEQVPSAIRKPVMARLQSLVGRRHVTEHDIERGLLLAGDLAGLRLRSALARGDQAGGARLIVEGTLDRLSGSVGIDNRLPSSLGTWQWAAGLVINNLLGLGDRVYVSAGSQFDMGRYGFPTAPFGIVGGGADVPISASGLLLGADVVYSRVQPKPMTGVPVTVGSFTRAQLRLGMPVIRTREQTLELTGTLSAIRQTLRAPDFAVNINRDSYEAVRFGMDWQRLTLGAPMGLNLTLSQGIAGRDGNDTLPLSRTRASSSFTNLTGQARIGAAMRGGTQFTLIARGQEAFGKPQLLPEQFGLDSADGVSAFPSGSYSVDSGVTVRGEISHAVPYTPRGLSLQPYLFAAQGWGWLENASAVEQRYVTAHAFGGGTRFGFSSKPGTVLIGFEVGYTGGRNRPDGARVSLTTSMRF